MIVKDNDRLALNPLVTVQVYAFNKERYIGECLDSIVNQKTSFEYEVIVSENPGTDKTREICLEYQKKYPEKIILVLREENMGLFYNYFEAERMSRGKYIARCDGDDYWCDENKLQKQVSFLENNPDYGMCYTRSRILDDETHTFKNEIGGLPWLGFKTNLLKEAVQQPTIMYKRELFRQYLEEIEPENKGWLMEDVPRTLWFAYNSKIERLDDITAVYRIVSNSLSHQVDYDKQEQYHRSILDIRLFFYNRYCPGETELIKSLYNDYYRRNIATAYSILDFKHLFENIIHYNYTSLKEVIRNGCVVCKAIVKRIFNNK